MDVPRFPSPKPWPWRRSPRSLDDPFAAIPLAPAYDPAPGEDPLAPPRRTRRWWLKRIALGTVLLLVAIVLWLALTAPLSKSLRPIAPPAITLLAADGTPIARNGASVDRPVSVNRLPPHVTQAFLAIEDRRFYQHWGIDPYGIARAAWSNVTTGRTQGGSTITQQLAKFTFLTPKQNLGRKAREALIALWLEAWLTKDQILERYLSNAYFGDNTYGLRAASLHYFYRQPEKLKLEQAAMLAGLLQAPSRYAPTDNPDRAARRMRMVLKAMAEARYITPAQARAAPTPHVDVRARNDLPTGTYFADWALPEARRLTEANYSRQTIRTTLDSRLQAAARQAIARAPLGRAQVALVAMRPNGEVVAMIGGRDYAASPFNRATQARRQPGSTFKLFVWLAALHKGMSPGDTVPNTPILQGSYRPHNSGERYSPTITLADGFSESSNVAAIRLWQKAGDDAVIGMARDLGVRSPLAAGDPSLALGTSTMTLMELTGAYAGVAANLYPVRPTAISAGDARWWESWVGRRHSLPRREHDAIEAMLRQVTSRGTGRAAALPVANFGKTGTSQDNRDALFVGYAGGLVVGVWIGNDDNTPLAGVYGGGLPARIWRDFMMQALGLRAPPRPAPSPNPQGPVQPLDLPTLDDIPLGDGHTAIGIRNGEAVLSTDIRGVPFDVRLDKNGVRIAPAERTRPPEDVPVEGAP
ncbi:MAG: transglycosylase domain-containing protein [Croceibacterium sp.]